MMNAFCGFSGRTEGQALSWLLSLCSLLDLYPSLPGTEKNPGVAGW